MDSKTELAECATVEVGPGDVFVLTFPGSVTQQAAKRLSDILLAEFPENKVIVLSDGIRLGVIRRTAPLK